MKVRLARRYAQALFRLAQGWQVPHAIEEELVLVEQVFAEREARAFFENPSVSVVAKQKTIIRLFGNSVSVIVQNFLCHVTDKRRTELLPTIIKEYRTLVNQADNVVEVEITTVAPLAPPDCEQLLAQLIEVTGKKVELRPRIDQQILGGVIIQIGDKRIDNSVAGKLANLKTHMLNKSF